MKNLDTVRKWHCSARPSPAGGGILVAASGKEAPCRSSAAVPGCGCGRRLAASSNAGRDARPTRRRDACATRFTQDNAAPTALGRIELKIPIKILDSVWNWADSANQQENPNFKVQCCFGSFFDSEFSYSELWSWLNDC
jgi:hypothetical protein